MQGIAQKSEFMKPWLIDFETNQRCKTAQVWGQYRINSIYLHGKNVTAKEKS